MMPVLGIEECPGNVGDSFTWLGCWQAADRVSLGTHSHGSRQSKVSCYEQLASTTLSAYARTMRLQMHRLSASDS